MAKKPLTGAALRDARWVASRGAGTRWMAGNRCGFTAERLAQFLEHGVLVPTDDPSILVVGTPDLG